MSILNPSMNKMIAELVGMPPQQLAQYAAANQNDTMKFLAAKAASDMQKKQMAMGAAQQQQAAAPPVAEQVVQQMAQGLPEESGIGALPAPNMRGYAAGGIVAFADRGLVYDPYEYGYQDPGADAQAALRARAGAQRFTSDNYVDPAQVLAAKQAAGIPLSMDEQAQLRESQSAPTTYQSGPQLRKAAAARAPSVATMPTDATRRTDSRFPSGVAALTPVSAPVGQRGTAPAAGAGATLAPSAGAASVTDIKKLHESIMPKGPTVDPYAAEGEAIGKIREKRGSEKLALAEEQAAGLEALLAPREQRIKDKEARQQKTDDMNINMSLINAGLAMMQSTGKGLAGIAEGAGVGVKQYSEGLKLSEAARQKIEDAKDAFDELKFNQTNMSKKEIDAAKGAIADGAIATKSESIKRLMDERNLNRADANKVFEATFTAQQGALDRASRERTAAFSAQVQKEIASMPGGTERFYATLGNGAVNKGFEYFTAATQEGKGDEALMQVVLKTPEILSGVSPALRKVIEQRIAERFENPKIVDVPTAGLKP